jgi:hypothetical protein
VGEGAPVVPVTPTPTDVEGALESVKFAGTSHEVKMRAEKMTNINCERVFIPVIRKLLKKVARFAKKIGRFPKEAAY